MLIQCLPKNLTMEQAFKLMRSLEAISKFWLRLGRPVESLMNSYVEEAKRQKS